MPGPLRPTALGSTFAMACALACGPSGAACGFAGRQMIRACGGALDVVPDGLVLRATSCGCQEAGSRAREARSAMPSEGDCVTAALESGMSGRVTRCVYLSLSLIERGSACALAARAGIRAQVVGGQVVEELLPCATGPGGAYAPLAARGGCRERHTEGRTQPGIERAGFVGGDRGERARGTAYGRPFGECRGARQATKREWRGARVRQGMASVGASSPPASFSLIQWWGRFTSPSNAANFIQALLALNR